MIRSSSFDSSGPCQRVKTWSTESMDILDATNCYNTLSQVRKMQAMRLPCRSRVWGRNNNQNVMWCLMIFDISMVRFWKADWYCWHPQSHGSGLQPGLAPSLGKRKKVGHGLKTGLLMGETSLESWTMLPVSHSQQGLPVWREEPKQLEIWGRARWLRHRAIVVTSRN